MVLINQNRREFLIMIFFILLIVLIVIIGIQANEGWMKTKEEKNLICFWFCTLVLPVYGYLVFF